jgi:hypothetical protein
MNPRKLCMLNNPKLVNAMKNLVAELEEDDSRPGFRVCRDCQFGIDNSLAIFDLHCQFEYAYDALVNISSQLEALSKQNKVS